MAARNILIYPQYKKELRKKSIRVAKFTNEVKELIRDLKDTLQASSDGIGLAAPQINFHQRVVIVCLGDDSKEEWQASPPIALINPQIIESSDERQDFDGCLSFPGLYGTTIRPHHLRVTGLNEQGQHFYRVFDGWNAVVVHHEIDHLDGILFIDRIQKPEDLYTIYENEYGEKIKVALNAKP